MCEGDSCKRQATMMTLNSPRYDCFHGDPPLIPMLSRASDRLGFTRRSAVQYPGSMRGFIVFNLSCDFNYEHPCVFGGRCVLD